MRVVVTRAIHQAEELAAPLRDRGFEVLLVPVIGIAQPADPAPLREAAAECDNYDWIVFTSANAVATFAAELTLPRAAGRFRVAAIGPATAEAAAQNGLPVSVTPREYTAESLAEALGANDLSGKRILIPAAAVHRDVVPQALRLAGARVQVVEAYRNVIPSGAAERVAEVFCEPWPDWVTFASSSAVDNTVSLAGLDALRRVRIASIGPATSATIRRHSLAVAIEADPHTIPALAQSVTMARRPAPGRQT